MSAILLDTSYLISLADPARAHHLTAVSYLREALKRGVPLCLSAVAASEFQVKQAVTDLPLRNSEVLPFNIDHAMTAGLLMRNLQRDASDDRSAVKDDVKLIAQAICESLTHPHRRRPDPGEVSEALEQGWRKQREAHPAGRWLRLRLVRQWAAGPAERVTPIERDRAPWR